MCAGWLKAQNLSTKGGIEGLLLQEGAQSREFKYLKVFEGFPQGVRAGVFFKDSKFQRKLKRGCTVEVFKGGQGQNTSKGDKVRSHPVEVKFQWKNLGLFRRSYQGAMSG